MGLWKFGLCVVTWVSCVSKINGDNSRGLLNTELECTEGDGILQIGPCIQCLCVAERLICVKVLCGLEADDNIGSITGAEKIAIYQKVRPPEVVLELPNTPIEVNTIYKQPVQKIQQADYFPDQVVAVSITASDHTQGGGLPIPISIQPVVTPVYTKENNALDNLLADDTPSVSKFLTETLVENVLKTLLTSDYDNNNDKYLLIVPEDFQSDKYEENKPLEETWQDNLNIYSKPQSNHKESIAAVPILYINKNKNSNLDPIMAVDEYGRPTAIPLARKPFAFARPGDKRLFMRPRHYMRNDEFSKDQNDDGNSSYLENLQELKYPWLKPKSVNNVPVKGPNADYWYKLLQQYSDLNSQHKSVGQKPPFVIKESLNNDFQNIPYSKSKGLKYPWLNRAVDKPNHNYLYKLLQQYGTADSELSSKYNNMDDMSPFFKKENLNTDLYTTNKLFQNYKQPMFDNHEVLSNNLDTDVINWSPGINNKQEEIESSQNNPISNNYNKSDELHVWPSTLENDQVIYQKPSSLFPKTYEGIKQIPVSDQFQWQQDNGYSEILSNKEPIPTLEYDQRNVLETGKNQQILNYKQQVNDSSYDTFSNKYSNIYQNLQNGPSMSMPNSIMPDQIQYFKPGSTYSKINNSEEQLPMSNEFQWQQVNDYSDGLLPVSNVIQTFDNKQQVKYTSNDSYTTNNFSKMFYGQQSTPVVSIPELLLSDEFQYKKPDSAYSKENFTEEEILNQIKWLQLTDNLKILNNKHRKPAVDQDQYYMYATPATYGQQMDTDKEIQTSNFYPKITQGQQSAPIMVVSKFKPGKFKYPSTGSRYPVIKDSKQDMSTSNQLQWQHENGYPSIPNYNEHEPSNDYDQYGMLANVNQQIFDNKQKVNNSNYYKQNWPYYIPSYEKPSKDQYEKLNNDYHKLNQQKIQQIRPIPISFPSSHLETLNDEQNSLNNSFQYEDNEGNVYITVPYTNNGIPDFDSKNNLLFNQNDSNYVVLSYPNINNNSQILNSERPKLNLPWYVNYENDVNKLPEFSYTSPPSTLFTGLKNIPVPYYNRPDNKKYEFSQVNSIKPKEPVLLPYYSESNKQNYFPQSHKNIIDYKPNQPNVPLYYDDQKPEFLSHDILQKMTKNEPSYKLNPNQLLNYESQNFPLGLNGIPNQNQNIMLPYPSSLLYDSKPVPLLQSYDNVSPLKLNTEPNYFSLYPKGLSNNKLKILPQDNLQIIPNAIVPQHPTSPLVPKQVIPGQPPQYYVNSIPKFPEKNLFNNLYESYYPLLASYPQVKRNNLDLPSKTHILKILHEIINNKPLKLFLKKILDNEPEISKNIVPSSKKKISDYNKEIVPAASKIVPDYDNNQEYGNEFYGPSVKPSVESNVYITLPEENFVFNKNMLLNNKQPPKKISNHNYKQPKIRPKFKSHINEDSKVFGYELPPSYDYNTEYPDAKIFENEKIKLYLSDLFSGLVTPGQTKPNNIPKSVVDTFLHKYKNSNNDDCVVCQKFINKIKSLAKYLNNNYQQYESDQNDIIYPILKDIIRPLVQFTHKLMSEKSNFPPRKTSAIHKPSYPKYERISVSAKFRPPGHNKNKKHHINQYYSKNLKPDHNRIHKILYRNDSPMSFYQPDVTGSDQFDILAAPENVNDYDFLKPNKFPNLPVYAKYKKYPKPQQSHGIARDESFEQFEIIPSSISKVDSENPRSKHLKPFDTEDDSFKIPKNQNVYNNIPQHDDNIFEDYQDSQEDDIDEYSPYIYKEYSNNRPLVHKLPSPASNSKHQLYLYENPNIKLADVPEFPDKVLNVKLYDKPYASDEAPKLTDEFNLIPIGNPESKQNTDDYQEPNDNDNDIEKIRDFYDRIRIALKFPKPDSIEEVYDNKINHDNKGIPFTDHYKTMSKFPKQQLCRLCEMLNCDHHIPYIKQNDIHNPDFNHIQNNDLSNFDYFNIKAFVPNTNPIHVKSQLQDSNIFSRLVHDLILDIIAESKSYVDNNNQETQMMMDFQESNALSDILSLLKYYQMISNINKVNRPHKISNLFQDTLPIISPCSEINTQSQPEYFPIDNDKYLDLTISKPHASYTTSNVLEILKPRVDNFNIEAKKQKDILNHDTMSTLVLKISKPRVDQFKFRIKNNCKLDPDYIDSDVIPVRTILPKFTTLPYQDMNTMPIKNLKNNNSEKEKKKVVWHQKENNLSPFFSHLTPFLFNKFHKTNKLSNQRSDKELPDNLFNYLKHSKAKNIHNFMPLETKKSNFDKSNKNHYSSLKHKTRNMRLDAQSRQYSQAYIKTIFNAIERVWASFISSDNDAIDFNDAGLFKPKDKHMKFTKYKNEAGKDRFPYWKYLKPNDQEFIYSDIEPVQNTKRPHKFTSKDHTKNYFDYDNLFKGHNKYPKAEPIKDSWQKPSMSSNLDKLPFKKQRPHNSKHITYYDDIEPIKSHEKPAKFWNKDYEIRPTNYVEPFKGYSYPHMEPSKYIGPKQKGSSNQDQFSFPKYLKPRGKGTKYMETPPHQSKEYIIKPLFDNSKPFKDHKFPDLESMKHTWQKPDMLSGQGPLLFPKYLKPRGINGKPENILTNDYEQKLSPDYDKLFNIWQKLNISSDEDQLYIPNQLKPKKNEYPNMEPIKIKDNTDKFMSNIKPSNGYNYPNKDAIKHMWQKPDVPFHQRPLPKYLKPKSQKLNHPDMESSKYKDSSDEFYSNDPFQNQEDTDIKPVKHVFKNPDTSYGQSQLPYPKYFKHRGKVNTNSDMEPPDYKAIIDEFLSKDFNNPSEIHKYVKPEVQEWEKPDKISGQDYIPHSTYLKPDNDMNEYSIEEPIIKKISYLTYNDDHDIKLNPAYANLKGHKHVDMEPQTKNPEILSDLDHLPHAEFVNSKEQDSKKLMGNQEFDTPNFEYDKDFKGHEYADEQPVQDSSQNFDASKEHAPQLEHFLSKGSEINLSDILYPLLNNKENPDKGKQENDIMPSLDYLDLKPETTEPYPNDYIEPIFEIDSKGRSARWADLKHFNIERASPNIVRNEYYVEDSFEEDYNDMT